MLFNASVEKRICKDDEFSSKIWPNFFDKDATVCEVELSNLQNCCIGGPDSASILVETKVWLVVFPSVQSWFMECIWHTL